MKLLQPPLVATPDDHNDKSGGTETSTNTEPARSDTQPTKYLRFQAPVDAKGSFLASIQMPDGVQASDLSGTSWTVTVEVAADGKARFKSMSPSTTGSADLDREIRDAAEQATFTPAMEGGEPAAADVTEVFTVN